METLTETTARPTPGGPRASGHFGVYQEEDDVLSLYATPFHPQVIAAALRTLRVGGVLLDVTPRWGAPAPTELDPDLLQGLEAPLEMLHAPSSQVDTESLSLLAAPHEALPRGSGRRFAFSLHDLDHGVFYTRDRYVLAAVLAVWLEERVAASVPPGQSPPVLDTTLDSVLAAVPPQAWRRLVLDTRRRFWSLDVSAMVADGDGGQEVIDSLTWVGGPSRAWRAGWSW